MTMLDRMRRYRNVLKWSLFIVVLAFILLYIPDFLRGTTDAGSAPRAAVAVVNGRQVTVADFRRLYNAQMQAMRSQYAGANEQLLRQLGIDRQVLQQLIDQEAALAEADRLGIGATDAEVRERIIRLPGLQENGQFIGEQRYKQLLRMQRPQVSHLEFEESIRRSIIGEKLQAAISEWITVADADVDAEYRRRNEQVKLDVIAFTPDKFRGGVTISDQALAAFFESHKDTYRIGEKRRIRFLPISVQQIRTTLNISPQDVEQAYNANVQQYSTPEQVRASHILFKTEGKDEAAVRKTAEEVLARARAGEDFAKLATTYSEDDGSKTNGGDLDFFSRGRMVPEFEAAAFTMEPGTISDLVKTQYGFHIIKVVAKNEARVRPIDEVRAQLTDQLKWERAQKQAQQVADRVAPKIAAPPDLDTVAKEEGLTVQESGFFLADEPIAGLGPSPEAASTAFSLADGKVSGPVRTADGFAFLTVTGKEAARPSTLEEVRDRVREDAIKDAAATAAREKAAEAAAALKSAADFGKAAKDRNLEIQTTELVARGAALPGVGVSPAVDEAAFKLSRGGVSDPIDTSSGSVIVRVVDRKDVSQGDVVAGREATRKDVQSERRTRFFSSYMTKAKERMKITIHPEVLSKLTV